MKVQWLAFYAMLFALGAVAIGLHVTGAISASIATGLAVEQARRRRKFAQQRLDRQRAETKIDRAANASEAQKAMAEPTSMDQAQELVDEAKEW